LFVPLFYGHSNDAIYGRNGRKPEKGKNFNHLHLVALTTDNTNTFTCDDTLAYKTVLRSSQIQLLCDDEDIDVQIDIISIARVFYLTSEILLSLFLFD
jgi:nitroimidazol reductase NimA-like FMN-containing flavoprotein (pyridoxamine 5'-phosphate oxidase superfamily)